MKKTEEIIKLLEAKGWREYKVNKTLDRHDRQWCQRVEEGSAVIRMWDHAKTRLGAPTSWDFELRGVGEHMQGVRLIVQIEDFASIKKLMRQVSAAWEAFQTTEDYVMVDIGYQTNENWVRAKVIKSGQDARPLFDGDEPAKWLLVELPGGERKRVDFWEEEEEHTNSE